MPFTDNDIDTDHPKGFTDAAKEGFSERSFALQYKKMEYVHPKRSAHTPSFLNPFKGDGNDERLAKCPSTSRL